MARSIDYRSTSPFPADEVYATMVDPEYLRARLSAMGGPGADLLEHTADEQGARYRLKHGVSARNLPPIATSMVRGDLVIERTESLTRDASGQYSGKVAVAIRGMPASAVGRMRLADQDGSGSEFAVRANVTVKVPLIGGKIEDVVADQVRNLLAAEMAFTLQWIEQNR
ncbi:MAG: DUF2505 domain-containing protein [Pseudonocardia sp.]